jgi:hypothetical protein
MKILTILIITLCLTITFNKSLKKKNELPLDINPDLPEVPSITNDPYLLQNQSVIKYLNVGFQKSSING